MARGENTFPQIAGLNIAHAVEMIGGNYTLYRRLIGKFPKNHGKAVTEIQSALENGDRDLAYRVAHSLKSVAGTIGAEELQNCAASVVVGLKKDMDISEQLEETERVMQEILQSIKQLE